MCDDIYSNTPKIKEQIKEMDEKEQEKLLKEKKKKDRRYDR